LCGPYCSTNSNGSQVCSLQFKQCEGGTKSQIWFLSQSLVLARGILLGAHVLLVGALLLLAATLQLPVRLRQEVDHRAQILVLLLEKSAQLKHLHCEALEAQSGLENGLLDLLADIECFIQGLVRIFLRIVHHVMHSLLVGRQTCSFLAVFGVKTVCASVIAAVFGLIGVGQRHRLRQVGVEAALRGDAR